MERLTSKAYCNYDPWECCGQDNYCKRNSSEKGGCRNGCIVPEVYKKLAAFEDICLSPKQAAEMKAELAKYKQAEADGRLMVLPFKNEGGVQITPMKRLTCNITTC